MKRNQFQNDKGEICTLPTIAELAKLFVRCKSYIDDDFRCSDDPDDDTPGMCVTVGANEDGSWNYQTGDNSFTGGAYGFRHWAVIYLFRDSNCRELAKDAQDQLAELMQ